MVGEDIRDKDVKRTHKVLEKERAELWNKVLEALGRTKNKEDALYRENIGYLIWKMERIVKEVIREWKLPLKKSKQERLILRDKRRKKRKDVKDEQGGVGGNSYYEDIEKSINYRCVSMVWNGEIVGIQGALEKMRRDREVLILTDSEAAIKSLVKARKRGRVRTHDLKWVMVKLEESCSKIHFNNKRADSLAKAGAGRRGFYVITEGEVRQWYKRKYQQERIVLGFGLGRIVRWNRRVVEGFKLAQEEEEEAYKSDNKTMRLKSVKKGKGKLIGESLARMVEELGYSVSFMKDLPEILVARNLFPVGKATMVGNGGDSSDIVLEDAEEVESSRRVVGLSGSRYTAKGLTKEEADEIMRKILDKLGSEEVEERSELDLGDGNKKITGGEKEDKAEKIVEEIEAIRGGRPFKTRKSLVAAKSAVNTAGLILSQGGVLDTTGGDSWEDLEDEAIDMEDKKKVAWVKRAKRGYMKVIEGGWSTIDTVGKKLEKLSEVVSILAALQGIGTPEECEKARKLQIRKQAQVTEAKRVAMEVKKITIKEKEEKEVKRGMEEARVVAEKATKQVESLEKKEEAVRAAAVEEIEMYKLLDKNTIEPKKIEERRKLSPKVYVGKGLVVISKKSEGRAAWTTTGSVTYGSGDLESNWEIRKVPEEVSIRGVLGRAWVKREETVRLVAINGPINENLGSKDLNVLLKEENIELGVVFKMQDSAEAVKVVKKGITWKSKIKKVAYVRDGKVEVENGKSSGKLSTGTTGGLAPQLANPSKFLPSSGPRGWQMAGRPLSGSISPRIGPSG
ncbi:hypothetical protein EV426DRAFT_703912 [Tirmania nivea]|nr:hypothetical protein EV426DRAFT_703912 [Tirmania nivea]